MAKGCSCRTSPLAFTASSGPDRVIRMESCSECDRNFWFRNGELVDLAALLPQLSLDSWKGKRRIAS
jgi:hypothetical protein